MSDNYGIQLKELEVPVFRNQVGVQYHLSIDKLEYVKNIKNYYTDNTLHNFIHSRRDESYHENNDGHPNELGSKMWAIELEKIIRKQYE